MPSNALGSLSTGKNVTPSPSGNSLGLKVSAPSSGTGCSAVSSEVSDVSPGSGKSGNKLKSVSPPPKNGASINSLS